jgi:hypothetical protein
MNLYIVIILIILIYEYLILTEHIRNPQEIKTGKHLQTINIMDFRDMTPCSFIGRYEPSGGNRFLQKILLN